MSQETMREAAAPIPMTRIIHFIPIETRRPSDHSKNSTPFVGNDRSGKWRCLVHFPLSRGPIAGKLARRRNSRLTPGFQPFEMDPLTPNDPLWKLLGKSREVRVRDDFARDVARAARSLPRERGWLARAAGAWRALTEWLAPGHLPRFAAAAAVLLLAALAVWSALQPGGEGGVIAPQLATAQEVPPAEEAPLIADVEIHLESMDYVDALLALEDTSQLSDQEIAYLLY
jgi:hypothetical protein